MEDEKITEVEIDGWVIKLTHPITQEERNMVIKSIKKCNEYVDIFDFFESLPTMKGRIFKKTGEQNQPGV